MIELNRIYNEDCLIGMQRIDDNSIDCILTDPPYLYLKNQKLDRPFDEQRFFNEAKRVLKPKGFIVLFGRGTSFYRWNTILAGLGFNFKEEIIWNKSYNSSPVSTISRVHEAISISTKGNGTINRVKVPYLEQKKFNISQIIGDINRIKSALNNTEELDAMKKFLETGIRPVWKDRVDKWQGCTVKKNSTKAFRIPAVVLGMITEGMNEKDIIECPHDRYSRIHPTQKPVRLLERLLALVSKEGGVVLDPFIGSASTAIAALNTGCNFIGFEIDGEYYKAASKRLNSHINNNRNLFNQYETDIKEL
jgi:site-specific DNA-methyltransferase (adenine-specific)